MKTAAASTQKAMRQIHARPTYKEHQLAETHIARLRREEPAHYISGMEWDVNAVGV